MKQILLIAFIFAFALAPTGGAGFALANGGGGGPECTPHTTEIVSDTDTIVVGNGNAVSVTPHPAWTADITGATWVWQSGPTSPNETVEFEQDFNVPGDVLSATLYIATDNSYSASINGNAAHADAAENNFQLATQDSYDVTADILSGANTINIEVTNIGTYNEISNPAGLLYKLVVESEECPEPINGDDKVSNKNSAVVINHVSSSANTGGNSADGGNGGDGGDAGGGFLSDNNDGGDGGNGGEGGVVITGDAGAVAGVTNFVNVNRTSINRCACGGGEGDVEVRNRNRAFVANDVDASAKTGYNDANGGEGGEGGSGSGVFGSDNNDGGNGGDGGEGGFVWTGNAFAGSSVLNVVNRNSTRIRR